MNKTLGARIKMLVAVIGFALAMLLGGGAPHGFIDGAPPVEANP